MKNTYKNRAKLERQKIFDTARRFDGWTYLDLRPYYEFCTQNTIDGLWLEFGVFRCATIEILASLTTNTVYGFDSFEGLPEDWHKTDTGKLPKGYYNINGIIPNVIRQNIILIKGWFQDTLPIFINHHDEPCSVIHIDSDLYSSAKTIFNYLRNKIIPGTIILFDELIGHKQYDYPRFYKGEMKAWLEEDFKYKYLAYTHGPQVGVKIL